MTIRKFKFFDFDFEIFRKKNDLKKLVTLTVRISVGEGTTAFYSCSFSGSGVDSGEAVISAVETSVVSMVSTFKILILEK